ARRLPAPSARSVVAAVEGRQGFGARVEAEALRLGLPLSEGLTVLGDGAEWVWGLAEDHFHGAAQVLDVWHGAQKLAEAGRAGRGAGEAFGAWRGQAKGRLVADGYAGACEALAALGAAADASPAACAEVAGKLNYFAGHKDRLNYALRLRRGQPIGSGLGGGSIKQLVKLPLKGTGGRGGGGGGVGGVGPFVEFVAVADGPEWREFWATLAA